MDEQLQHRLRGLTFEVLTDAMRACPQTPTQSVLQHGESVVAHFQTLMAHLRDGETLPDWWRVPAWTSRPGLLEALPSPDILDAYQRYHDCGKPFCRLVDADGRQHFPNHAALSEQVWLAVGGDPLSARLMGMDMDAHLLKGDGLDEFAARPEAPALLLTAIAEVHSNASLFGGQNSDSFKAKAKHLDKRGRQVMDRAPSLSGSCKP